MGVSFFERCQELASKGLSFVTVTIVSTRGSVPQDAGAKMIVTDQGLDFGTIGGGRVEHTALSRAQEIIQNKTAITPLLVTWNLQKDIGMSCGGECTFLFEYFPSAKWPIVIFGAGHVAQALTRILSTLNCQITCIDPREEWTSKLTGVKAICHPSPKDLVRDMDPKSFFLCLTMGHAYDLEIVPKIFEHAPDAPYVGVIGSDIKALRLKKELKDLGIPQSFIEKLRIPMGLFRGSNLPEEIAISIAAEILQMRDN